VIATPPEQSPTRSIGRRRFLAIPWIAALALLVVTSANPVTLNVVQIRRAAGDGAIIAATVLDAATGKCRVDAVLTASPTLGDALRQGNEIRIVNLRETKAAIGKRYIIPLAQSLGMFAVVPTGLPDRLPLIYPSSPETRALVDAMLQGGGG